MWFTGITAILLLFSHYANNLLRALHKKNSLLLSHHSLTTRSSYFYLDEVGRYALSFAHFQKSCLDGCLTGDLSIPVADPMPAQLQCFSFSRASQIQESAAQSTLSTMIAPTEGPINVHYYIFAPERGQVINLILLEMKMIWRNKRPKHYFILSIVFRTGLYST